MLIGIHWRGHWHSHNSGSDIDKRSRQQQDCYNSTVVTAAMHPRSINEIPAFLASSNISHVCSCFSAELPSNSHPVHIYPWGRGVHGDGILVPSPPVPADLISIPIRPRTDSDPSPPVPAESSMHPHPSPHIFCQWTKCGNNESHCSGNSPSHHCSLHITAVGCMWTIWWI